MQHSRKKSLLAPKDESDPLSLRIVQPPSGPILRPWSNESEASDASNRAQEVPIRGLRQIDVADEAVVAGFGSRDWKSRSWVHPTSIRIRARIAAAELLLSGVSKPRQAQIGLCIGRSGRTVIDHFAGFDSVFAFPPPELAPVTVDAWSSAQSLDQFTGALLEVFSVLDANPTARRLFSGLAAVHSQDPSRVATDGHFAFALRCEIDRRGLNWADMTRWTGFLTDAVREALLPHSRVDESLVGLVPKLRVSLAPLPFPEAGAKRATMVS
jgi:hypothetical protein